MLDARTLSRDPHFWGLQDRAKSNQASPRYRAFLRGHLLDTISVETIQPFGFYLTVNIGTQQIRKKDYPEDEVFDLKISGWIRPNWRKRDHEIEGHFPGELYLLLFLLFHFLEDAVEQFE